MKEFKITPQHIQSLRYDLNDVSEVADQIGRAMTDAGAVESQTSIQDWILAGNIDEGTTIKELVSEWNSEETDDQK